MSEWYGVRPAVVRETTPPPNQSATTEPESDTAPAEEKAAADE